MIVSDARAFQSTLKMQSYLASITFAILFSLTFVIFPLGQYYISLWSVTGFYLHWDCLPGSKVSYQGGLKSAKTHDNI